MPECGIARKTAFSALRLKLKIALKGSEENAVD